jgi:hypothetical protein
MSTGASSKVKVIFTVPPYYIPPECLTGGNGALRVSPVGPAFTVQNRTAKARRFCQSVGMKHQISVWEGEGGSLIKASEKALTGTVNQIEWAKQIKVQVNAEFDRVRKALEAATAGQSGQERVDTEAIIAILEDKRVAVMTHEEAGYFIHDWQEIRDQVRQMIMKDSRYKTIKARSSPRP